MRFPHPETVRIGSATLIRADSLFDVLGALMPGSIGSVLTDPPYSSGALHARDRAQAPSQKYQSSEFKHLQAEFLGDNRDQRSFLAWSALWMHRAQLAMRPGAILAAFTDWRQLPVTTDALQVAGLVWRGIVPWDKTEAVRPQLGRYRNQAEFLVWGTNGHRAAVGRVAPGAYRASVPKAKLHMAAKPVSLMRDLLAIVDGPVLDPFMGSSPIGEACAEPGAAPAELQRLRAIRGGRDRHAGERPRGYRRAARLSRATGGDRGAARRGAPHRDRDAGSPRTRRWRASPRRFAPAARSLSRSAPPTRTSARIAGSARSGMPGLRRARAPPTASARPAARGGRKPPYPSCRRGTARGNLGHAGAARRHAGRGCRRAPRRISPR